MESIWRKTETASRKRESLTEEIRTEAAVIGGGISGILTAWFLQSRGVDTVVLEAETIGSGQTENTTAKITSQHNLIYDKLIKTVGTEQAWAYARASQQAIEDYETIIRQKKIDCFFERKPAYLYTRKHDKIKEALEREVRAAQRLGIPALFTERPEQEQDLPFPITGAVRFDNQAQFHPLLFLNALAEELTIY